MRPSIRGGLGIFLVLALGDAPLRRAQAEQPDSVVASADPAEAARRRQVVAQVGSVPITVGKIEDHLASQSPILRTRYNDPAEMKKLADSLVRFELLAAEAQRRGYGKNPTVVRTVEESTVQNLMRAEIDEKITPQTIAAEEVKAYFDSHPEEFHRVAMRRASHVLFDTEAEAKAAVKQLAALDQRGFAELAKKDSKDIETKLRGGDLGYFAKQPQKDSEEAEVHAALRNAAFELKNAGDTLMRPVAVEQRFSVVRLTGERAERHTSRVDAEPSIRTRIWREKRQAAMAKLVEDLRKKEKPETFPERVDLVKLDDMDKGPGGFLPEPGKVVAPKKGGK